MGGDAVERPLIGTPKTRRLRWLATRFHQRSLEFFAAHVGIFLPAGRAGVCDVRTFSGCAVRDMNNGLQAAEAGQPRAKPDHFIIGMSGNNHRRPFGNLFIGRERAAIHTRQGRVR